MRMRMLALAGLLLGGAAQAGGDALIIGNSRPGAMQSFFGSARVVAAAERLRAAGLDVSEVTEGDSRAMDLAFARFVDGIAPGDGPLIVVLAGTFVHSATATYLLPVGNGQAMGPAQVMTGGFALDAALAVLAQAPGRAFLVLGEAEDAVEAGPYFLPGPGALDIPQGVTVIRGPATDVANWAVREMVRPDVGVDVAASGYELVLEGYLPAGQAVLRHEEVREEEGDADPGPWPLPPARAQADEAAWLLAQQSDNARGYTAYLQAFPTGLHAAAARQRLKAIEEEPYYAERRAEEALELSRDARREIQRNLSIVGFDTRGIDGIFGRGTRAAIAQWQQSVGFVPSGYVNAMQIARLDRAARERADALEAEARQRAEELARQDRALWNQVRGREDEAGLRRYLEQFPEGQYADQATLSLQLIENARAAQAAERDRYDWDRARSADTVAAYRLYLEAQPRGAFASEAAARIEAINRAESESATIAQAKAQEKAIGLNAVTRQLAETRLKQLGLKPGEVDGKFDEKTRRAIRDYQRTRGLVVTGYLDEKTVVRLLAEGILRR